MLKNVFLTSAAFRGGVLVGGQALKTNLYTKIRDPICHRIARAVLSEWVSEWVNALFYIYWLKYRVRENQVSATLDYFFCLWLIYCPFDALLKITKLFLNCKKEKLEFNSLFSDIFLFRNVQWKWIIRYLRNRYGICKSRIQKKAFGVYIWQKSFVMNDHYYTWTSFRFHKFLWLYI